MLELETWEIAPGRIRNEESQIMDNIAFSNSYLTQNQAVRISREISFQVITIKPGTVYTWESSDKLRLCSVACGKLTVKVQAQEFGMEQHGMFRVKAGASASVLNRLYLGATLHVTVMPNDL